MEPNKDIDFDRVYDPVTTIDIWACCKKLWVCKMILVKSCCVGALLGLIVAFSIPKEYTTTVMLAPENADGKSISGGLGALAAMAGVNVNAGQSNDAVYPDLYPDIVSSIPFNYALLDVNFQKKKATEFISLYDYIDQDLSQPWWSAILKFPLKAVGKLTALFRDEVPGIESEKLFALSKEQMDILKELKSRVKVSVDKKTSVVSMSVTMQDPVVSASLTDTIMVNLQKYITDYRTKKARLDLEFTEQLYNEAQEAYYVAQQKYAKYLDFNQGVRRNSEMIEQTRLQNEATLAFNLYNQMAQQLQMARVKVMENTPVYVILQPAIVPVEASSPSKIFILVSFVFLAAAVCGGWILFGSFLLEKYRSIVS